MKRLLPLFLLLVVSGCVDDDLPGATGATGVATPAPGATPTSRPRSLGALAGQWVFGDGREPAPGPVATCDPPQVLTLYQEGTIVHGDVQTCASATRCAEVESFAGAVTLGRLQLAGAYKGNQLQNPEDVTYDLVFDATTQHLTGTRNGRAFWAAPRLTPATRDCERIRD